MKKKKTVKISELKPNNWYINRDKLDRVREVWETGNQENLPPVETAYIDGELSLIDGHSRTYAAYEKGETEILIEIHELEKLEGPINLYQYIHRQAEEVGIETIADLQRRIVDPRLHKMLWVSYCQKWLQDNG